MILIINERCRTALLNNLLERKEKFERAGDEMKCLLKLYKQVLKPEIYRELLQSAQVTEDIEAQFTASAAQHFTLGKIHDTIKPESRLG